MDGNNESQDSEQVLELYQSIYGVGLVSVRRCVCALQGAFRPNLSLDHRTSGAVPRPMC
jgi:hypothetical protein